MFSTDIGAFSSSSSLIYSKFRLRGFLGLMIFGGSDSYLLMLKASIENSRGLRLFSDRKSLAFGVFDLSLLELVK